MNHVVVQPGATATAHGWLRVGSLCKCIMAHGAPVVSLSQPPAPAPLEGQVVDDAGRPLPYATLDLVTVQGRETAYTDHEDVASMRPSALVDYGIRQRFEAVTKEVSGTTSGPLVSSFRTPAPRTSRIRSTSIVAPATVTQCPSCKSNADEARYFAAGRARDDHETARICQPPAARLRTIISVPIESIARPGTFPSVRRCRSTTRHRLKRPRGARRA